MADSLKANDPKTAFDVLWEIESFPLFLQAVAEEVARDADAGGAGDDKEKKKSSKDKKKSKVCVFCGVRGAGRGGAYVHLVLVEKGNNARSKQMGESDKERVQAIRKT